ncbi:MAG TPA: hypothetical protein VF006_31900 [Longimicrobium sp.]
MSEVDYGNNIDEMRSVITAGQGAQFWVYVSSANNTQAAVTRWSVSLESSDGRWSATITNDSPSKAVQTPGLSGIFLVKVTGSGPKMSQRELTPLAGTRPGIIGCNSNCASMVGIVADPGGTDAHYWTTWDALCNSTSSS